MTLKRLSLSLSGAIALATVCPALLVPAAHAAPGELDPSFAESGFRLDPVFASQLTGLARMDNGADAAALDESGRLLAIGGGPLPGTITIVRYTSTGQLDPTFGMGGAVEVQVYPEAVEPSNVNDRNPQVVGAYVQSDGEVVVAGNLGGFKSEGGFIARFDPVTMSLDNSFGSGGVTRLPGETVITGLAEDESGRPVVAGRSYPGDLAFVARMTSSGQPDTTFGHGGSVTTRLNGPSGPGGGFGPVTTLGDEVVASSDLTEADGAFVARYEADGELDNHFGKGGVARFFRKPSGFVRTNSIAALPNGKLLVVGGLSGPLFMARLTKSGSLDRGFGSYGMLIANLRAAGDEQSEGSSIGGMAVEGSGRIVLAGTIHGQGVRCYKATATVRGPLPGGGCQHGSTDHLVLARYLPAGTPDCAFGHGGVTSYKFQGGSEERISVAGALIDPQNRLLLAGSDASPAQYLAAAFQLGSAPAHELNQTAPPASVSLLKQPVMPLSALRRGELRLTLRVKDALASRCSKDFATAVLTTGSPATPASIASAEVQAEGEGHPKWDATGFGVLSAHTSGLTLKPTALGRRLLGHRRSPKLWLTVELQNSGAAGVRAVLKARLPAG